MDIMRHLKINMFKILAILFLFFPAPTLPVLPISVNMTNSLQNYPNHETGWNHSLISLKPLRYLLIYIFTPYISLNGYSLLSPFPLPTSLFRPPSSQSLLLKQCPTWSPHLPSYALPIWFPHKMPGQIFKCPCDHINSLLKTYLFLAVDFLISPNTLM